jgi:hypothetical protein
MTTLIVDEPMLARLREAKGLIVFRDTSGKIVGHFSPAGIDWVEIQRRKDPNRRGYTTRQVFEHLMTLTQDEKELAHLQQLIDQLAETDA